ncbi:MAG: hypothetical protein JWO15_1364 [Sphingomonadales bacterium]|nr:hypothetical protein [Sphingomonadales bacterium]
MLSTRPTIVTLEVPRAWTDAQPFVTEALDDGFNGLMVATPRVAELFYNHRFTSSRYVHKFIRHTT